LGEFSVLLESIEGLSGLLEESTR